MNVRVTEDVFDPNTSGARENKFPFLRAIFPKCMIGGILKKQPAEVGLGTEMAVGDPAVDCRVIALRSFQIAVPLVANVAERRHAYTRRLREKRNQILTDGDIHRENKPEGHTIIDYARLADFLLGLNRPFQSFRSECCDVNSIVVKGRKGKPPARAVEPSRRVIAQKAALLQASGIRFESDGMVAAAKVKPRDAKRNARAYPGLAQRLSCADSRLTGLKFKSQPVIERVAFGFLHVDEHVLLQLIAFWIFVRGILLAENSQIG